MIDYNEAPSISEILLGQKNRLLKLTTTLGPDVLIPQRVVAHDRLSRGYEYTVDCLCVRKKVKLKTLIAKPITLWVQQVDSRYLPVHGYVHTAKRLGSDGAYTFCQLSFAPWMHFLKFRKDARIWQDRPADDIITEVFNNHSLAQGNFRFDVRDHASPRPYCLQYETDWHFVQRLMEEEGWFFYHEQKSDGTGHVLVVTDTSEQMKPVGRQAIQFHGASTEDELNRIVHWSASRSVGSTRFTGRTDDYKSPHVLKQTSVGVLVDHGDLPAQLEVYEYTGPYSYQQTEHGDKQARLRAEQWESSMKRFYGVSGVRSLPAGGWFTLDDHPAHRDDTVEDRQFMVIAVEWCIENNLPFSNKIRECPGSLLPEVAALVAATGRNIDPVGTTVGATAGAVHAGYCFNRFEVQRRKVPFRNPLEHFKPTLHPQTAVVVGPAGEEIHTDHLNRVKVHFRWDRLNPGDERASCWVRVSYPNAGQGWGALHVPRVGQEVIATFLDGDGDRPVITSRLYNADQTPDWHTDGKLSGYKSKEYKGTGFNQLVMDDTSGQNRIQLYSTSAHAQLNLGYLVNQRGNKRGGFYGSGFALSTDDFGAIVTQKGLLLSTFGKPGPHGTQLSISDAAAPLKAGATLTKTLSDTATKAGAEPLSGQEGLGQFIAATADRYEAADQSGANRFKTPILLAASPAGIGLASSKDVQVHGGVGITLSSGTDTNIAVGKSLLAAVAEKISLFAFNAGIKLFAAKGKVEVQAQSNDLDLIAEKVVRLLSTNSRIEIHAKDEVIISAGGSFIKIDAAGITNGTSGSWTAQASIHTMKGPATQSHVMPHLKKPAVEKTDLEFRHFTDWGEPLGGAAYKAILSDGSIRKGVLDALGIARISDLPAGVSAKIEYDYRPMQASSTVSTELHDDVHELLKWLPGKPVTKGRV